MQDKELYQHILGLNNPWTVQEVVLDQQAKEIVVRVNHPDQATFSCSQCDHTGACYDHAGERRWRHLDSCQFKTILVASVPRIQCPVHGIKNVAVPWAEKYSRFTLLFERFAIDVLRATQTVKGAMNVLGIKWDQAWNILLRAVKRGQARKQSKPIVHLGIDEKSFREGHSYVTLLDDLQNSTVEAISEGHDVESAKACFSQLSEEQIASVQAIAMDMSPSFVRATKETIPLAEEKIVHDRFHVMQLANKAVDKVRRQEHRTLLSKGDDRPSKSKYLWLKGEENLSEAQRATFASIYHGTLQTSKAWCSKEVLRGLWDQCDARTATAYFNKWYRSVIYTKLEPMKVVARTIKERLGNVISYCTHRITNAVAEGMNSKIMSIKRRVGGYRNIENFKTAVYFHCGGLDLYPR